MDSQSTGLTLLELLVALLLIGFGVLAVAPMFVSAMTSNAASADFGLTGAHAVERMERLREAPYYALTVGGGLTGNVSGYVEMPESGIVVRWQVADNGSVVAGTKIVTVRALALRDLRGPQRDVTLSTIRGN